MQDVFNWAQIICDVVFLACLHTLHKDLSNQRGGVISGHRLEQLNYELERPIIEPFLRRQEVVHDGITLSYGVGPAGYDIRADLLAEHGSFIVLGPGSYELIGSIERFQMPNFLLAEIADKSTWVRLGLTVQNSKAEPGWCGYLTLEIANHSQKPIKIYHGDPIAHIVFHEIKGHVIPYNGKYQNQPRGPQKAI